MSARARALRPSLALTSAGACVVTLTGVFNWRSRLGTLGDWEDVPLKGRTVAVCFDADAKTNANVARAMARLGKWLRSKGAKKVLYIATPDHVSDVKTKGADDYLAAGGTLDGLLAAGGNQPPEVGGTDGSFSDAVLAEVLADELLTDQYLWTGALGWLHWTGQRWKRCDDVQVHEAVRRHFLDWFTREVAAGCDSSRREGLYSLLGAGRIKQITGLARGIVHADAADFDQQPDLLNTPSGVVDLRSGELLPHDPSLLMTKVTRASYNPAADHTAWTTAQEALPREIHGWLQTRVGQAITGHMTPDDALVVSQGGGENGKTTFFGAIAHALGDYHTLVSDRVLLANPEAHPTELMELRGARFALIEETPEARRLSVARLKKTVGTPQIEARYIRQDSVTFDATHSLFVSTNYRPIVEETDHGTWRRLILLRFPYRYVKPGQLLTGPDDRTGDLTLRERLKTDDVQQAVLRWLVDGARAWYAAEKVLPPPPACVAGDTREWRMESDLVLCYVDDRLVFDVAGHVIATELLTDFNEWLTARGHRSWSDKTFAARFGDHDELARFHVEKRQTRRGGTGPSRPTGRYCEYGDNTVPARYMAWLGVRFATNADINSGLAA